MAALSLAGVVLRPFGWPEAVWPVGGAALLVASGAIPAALAWRGIVEGGDVYLFLTGMMLLSELARREGLFDWLAAWAARRAAGSAPKLFVLLYVMGVAVTVFLSNDATAVVLTPAVAAAARAAGSKNPVPFLLICALVANAASFVLPISNPANLVSFGAQMPKLTDWLKLFALPAAAAIFSTFVALYLTQHPALRQKLHAAAAMPALSRGGLLAACGILATAVALLAASGFGVRLGLPAFLAGAATAALVLVPARQPPWGVLRNMSWDVLALVAGLFVLVAALGHAGLTADLARGLRQAAAAAPQKTFWAAGLLTAFGCNLVNNLPLGLLAGHAVQAASVTEKLRAAVVAGIDLGPNLSVTGSLATILWLNALRRDELAFSAWAFLRIGIVVMPVALLCAMLCIL